ncbi:MAG: PEP-CTERM sorting domain-containing protein [Burkholderiales bacterium]|jgi:hypothetical protein|nr:MAG: PEP-CTERM sorting domain-containing protein [Burkholderiales bacterium]
MSLLKKKLLALAVVALTPLAAHATVPNSTFQFYFEGPVFDEVSTAPTFVSGDLGVTIRAFKADGTQIDVDKRWDGIGASSGFLDPGELTSSVFDAGDKGEYLTLTFNRAVQISSLRFSMWENGLFDSFDHAQVSWGSTTASLGNSNDNGLILKTFSLSKAIGTTFKIQATGDLSSFRLAGINAVAAPVPEPATYGLMGLGLAGLGLAKRRRQG